MLAHLSKDEKLIAAYRNGADIHTQTASAIFEVPRENVLRTSAAMRKL
jgi:DNA polymerase-1